MKLKTLRWGASDDGRACFSVFDSGPADSTRSLPAQPGGLLRQEQEIFSKKTPSFPQYYLIVSHAADVDQKHVVFRNQQCSLQSLLQLVVYPSSVAFNHGMKSSSAPRRGFYACHLSVRECDDPFRSPTIWKTTCLVCFVSRARLIKSLSNAT